MIAFAVIFMISENDIHAHRCLNGAEFFVHFLTDDGLNRPVDQIAGNEYKIRFLSIDEVDILPESFFVNGSAEVYVAYCHNFNLPVFFMGFVAVDSELYFLRMIEFIVTPYQQYS